MDDAGVPGAGCAPYYADAPSSFLPTARQINWLLIVGFLSVGYALYVCYVMIEQSSAATIGATMETATSTRERIQPSAPRLSIGAFSTLQPCKSSSICFGSIRVDSSSGACPARKGA